MLYLTNQMHQNYCISLNGQYLMSANKVVLCAASPFFRRIIEEVPGSPDFVDLVGACTGGDMWASVQYLYHEVVYSTTAEYLQTLPQTVQGIIAFFKLETSLQDKEVFNPALLPSRRPFNMNLNKVLDPAPDDQTQDLHEAASNADELAPLPIAVKSAAPVPESVEPGDTEHEFDCLDCNKKYLKKKHLLEHRRKVHKEKTKTVYLCGNPNCGVKHKTNRDANRCRCVGAKIKKGGKYKVGTETMDMESYDLVFNVPLDLLPPSAAQSATVGQEDPVNVEGDSVTTGEIDSLELMES